MLREQVRLRKDQDTRDKPVAFDDGDLRDWLIDVIQDGSHHFLCAFAEAVVTASAEDYCVVRPVLIELKRKYSDRTRKRICQQGSAPGCAKRR
jgi:hypothetical protein